MNKQTDYCSFTTSRRLAQIGFHEPVHTYYKTDTDGNPSGDIVFTTEAEDYNSDFNLQQSRCSAPTLWDAKEFLKKNYNLYIELTLLYIDSVEDYDDPPHKIYYFPVYRCTIKEFHAIGVWLEEVWCDESSDWMTEQDALKSGIDTTVSVIDRVC